MADVLSTVHSTIAMTTGQEHWELADSESKELANLAGDVLQYYGVVVSERAGLTFELVTVLGSIYGSRAIMSIREANAAAIQPATPVEPIATAAVDPSTLNGHAAPASAIGAAPLVNDGKDSLIPPMFRAPKQ